MTEQDPCNSEQLVKELKGLEILRELRDDLEDGPLYNKLGNLITEQEEVCNKMAGECGKLDPAAIIDEDTFADGEEGVEVYAGWGTGEDTTE